MPRVSIWAVRASLIHLLVGITIGGLILANKGLPFWPQVWSLLPPHVDILIFGWVIQLAMGVAYWILPRYAGGSRGRVTPVILSFILLNVGVVFISLQLWVPAFLLIGRTCLLAAGALFAFHARGRIKPLYPSSGQ